MNRELEPRSAGLDRRDLLRAAGAAALCATNARALGPQRDLSENVLVVIELRGGNDGLNTLVPWRDERYYELRPLLALPRRGLLRVGDGAHALAPELARLHARFERGQAAAWQGVGYPQPNLSHFRSRDVWAAAAPRESSPSDGWLGRWDEELRADLAQAATPAAPRLLAIGTDVVPLALRSAQGEPLAFGSPVAFQLRAPAGERTAAGESMRLQTLRRLHASPASNARVAELQRAFEAARRASERVARLHERETRVRFPGDSLGRALASVAKMIAGELGARCYHVTLDGFDTHTSQGRDHPLLLARLDAALDAFLDELQAHGLFERVLVMTTSEFGRRVAESGVGSEAGTDHGTASVQFLAGGRVRAGVHGESPDLWALDEHGNLRHTLDFRAVYAAVLEDWLGGDARTVLGRAWQKPRLFA